MLTVNDRDIQLGILKYGQPYTFSYIITNHYTVPISITKVVTGCSSCTKASIDKNLLQPNESATVTAVFTPGSMGLQSKTISVFSATGHIVRPALTLKFRASVND